MDVVSAVENQNAIWKMHVTREIAKANHYINCDNLR